MKTPATMTTALVGPMLIASTAVRSQPPATDPSEQMLRLEARVRDLNTLVNAEPDANRRHTLVSSLVRSAGALRGDAARDTEYGVMMEWLSGRLLREGREREAIAILQELASSERAERRSSALGRLGALHAGAGRWRQALEAYEQQGAMAQATPAICGTASWSTGQINLLTLRRIHGDPRGALALSQFLSDHEAECRPETVRTARQQRAYVLHQLGDKPGAEAAAAEFLARYPDWDPPAGDRASFLAFHARLLRETGRPDAALDEASRAWREYRGRPTSKTVKLGEEVGECLSALGRLTDRADFQAELLAFVDDAEALLAAERTPDFVGETRCRLLVSLSEADRFGRPALALMALERLGLPAEPTNRGDHERAVARVRAALPDRGR